jgi:hypothetical protein
MNRRNLIAGWVATLGLVLPALAITPPAAKSVRHWSFDLGWTTNAPAAIVAKSPAAPDPKALGTGTGLVGAYFTNLTLSGAPTLVRLDAGVDFSFGSDSPDAVSIPRDGFSARWAGQVQPLHDGTNTFYTDSDDGVRLWVNGQLLIDNWTDHNATRNSGSLVLSASQPYDIRMEYYERTGGATARLLWSDTVSTNVVVIPASQLSTNATGLPDPAFSQHPAPAYVDLGGAAAYTSAVWGTRPVCYQWRKNGVEIPGATNAGYVTPPATTNDHGALFQAVVSNALGCATSVVAFLKIKNFPVPIEPGILYSNLYCYAGSDWYSIQVPSNGIVDAWIYFPIGSGNADLDFYLNGPATNLIGKSEGSSISEHIFVTNCVAGTYYLKVLAWDGAWNTYSLKVSQTTITVPDILAIEMPTPGQTTIHGSEAPLSNLLASATAAGGYAVTCDQMSQVFPLGGTPVTWTAWSGTPGVSKPLGQLSAYVFVFRHGQTPIGASGDDYATAGNHSASLGRTPDGALHAAWLDTGKNPDGTSRPIAVWYRRGTPDPETGVLTWSTPVDVTGGAAYYLSYVKLAATSNAVHFSWSGNAAGNDRVYYRRLVKSGGTWAFDPIQRVSTLTGLSSDNGLSMAAFSDAEVHIVAKNLNYAYTTNAANSNAWVKESLPQAPGMTGTKYPAVAVDTRGDVHLVYTAIMRSIAGTNYNNYGKVWYLHRKRPGPGSLGWVESHDTCAQWPEWQDPGVGTNGVWNDVVGDWMDIACDQDNTVFIGGHGTVVSRRWGHDDAFLLRRTIARDGDPLGWERPQRLHRHEADTVNNLQYSWTPSICCADTNGIVLPVNMFKALGAIETADPDNSFQFYNDMDSFLRVMQDDTLLDGDEGQNLSQAAVAGEKITTWWPCAARKLHRDSQGRAWLEILQSMDCGWVYDPNYLTCNVDSSCSDGIRTYVVCQRVDVTRFMPPAITLQPADALLATGQVATFTAAATSPTNDVPLSYQWLRNGAPIPGATNASYTTAAAYDADDGSAFAVQVTAISHTTSRAAQLRVLTLARAWSWGDSNAVWVRFSLPVLPGTGAGGAEAPARYTLNYNVSVTSAVLQADGCTVRLGTTPLLSGLSYILSVAPVSAAAAPAVTLAQPAATVFQFLPADATVWVDDALPNGAMSAALGGDSWSWTSTQPTPLAGTLAHVSEAAASTHAHLFSNATQTLAVPAGATLFTYVCLNPTNPPQELMLQFCDGTSWAHRAYWGASLIATGTENSASCTNLGALPPVGQWTRLEMPAATLGLEGATLSGMSFGLFGGSAAWDYSGVAAGTFHPVTDPTGCGIPDNWRVLYFTSTNAANSGPADDWDYDGQNNLAEYLAGTDPTNALSLLVLRGCSNRNARTTLTWPGMAGRSYSVQWRTNLLSGDWVTACSNIPAWNSGDLQQSVSNAAPAAFYRILLEQE